MAVKVLIKRQFQTEKIEQATKLLIRARYEAMKMDGYIASETWRDLEDARRIAVVSMWQTPQAWQAWYTSPQRREFSSEMEKIMDGGETIEPYQLGVSHHS